MVCKVVVGFVLGEKKKKKLMHSLSLECFPLTMGIFDEVHLCGCECVVRMVIPAPLTH